MLSATALPTFVGPCEVASPQNTWPVLLFETGPCLGQHVDGLQCRGLAAPADEAADDRRSHVAAADECDVH